MTQTTPCGPEPGELFSLALEQAQDLQRLTQDIQLQSKNPTLPVLTQLIFQREERLKAMAQLQLQDLSEAQQAILLEILHDCQNRDPAIEGQLKSIHSHLKEQIRNLKSGQTLIGKYKIDSPQQSGRHSKDA